MEPTTCSVEGCNRKRKYVATGWCQTHYHRYWRNRTLDTVGRKEPLSTKYRAVHTRVASLFGKAEHTACHHTFTTPANFDRHRRGFRCTQPNEVGLVRKNGKWMMPGKLDTEQDVE